MHPLSWSERHVLAQTMQSVAPSMRNAAANVNPTLFKRSMLHLFALLESLCFFHWPFHVQLSPCHYRCQCLVLPFPPVPPTMEALYMQISNIFYILYIYIHDICIYIIYIH